MCRNLYKLSKSFDDVIVILILGRHQNVTAKKVEGSRVFLLNISKTFQLIFTKLMSFLGNYLWNQYILRATAVLLPCRTKSNLLYSGEKQ